MYCAQFDVSPSRIMDIRSGEKAFRPSSAAAKACAIFASIRANSGTLAEPCGSMAATWSFAASMSRCVVIPSRKEAPRIQKRCATAPRFPLVEYPDSSSGILNRGRSTRNGYTSWSTSMNDHSASGVSFTFRGSRFGRSFRLRLGRSKYIRRGPNIVRWQVRSNSLVLRAQSEQLALGNTHRPPSPYGMMCSSLNCPIAPQ